ncbi:MAG: cupredoxin domain-containing protein, partial [Chloroflexota bacterium]
MRKENLARFAVISLAVSALVILAWGWWGRAGWVDVRARMPEYGGWTPADLRVRVGEPLRLRLTSEDVVHSFAIGQSDFEPVDIPPGKPAEVTLTFDGPGTYTFYCTRWCGANHWRMRGTITVTGDGPINADVPEPPLYLQLGIDLDAGRDEPDLELGGQPSSERGASLGLVLPLMDTRSRSPYQIWSDLGA